MLLAALAQAQSPIYKHIAKDGSVTYTDQALPGASVFVLNDNMVEQLDLQVKLETKKHEAGETLLVRNDLYAPVQIELELSNVSNALGAPDKPISWVLQPRSQIRLVSLAPRNKQQPMRYTPKLRYALGDPRLLPKNNPYPLPWLGGPFRLTQGANGKYSHFTPKGRYALDIAMPEGTPIVAARSGMVVKIENHQSGRGDNPSGNFVRILHDDGTMGVYLHLMRNSVAVREGQRIKLGDKLALSGNTGNSTGPHLHFVVQRNVGMALESIPFNFAQPVDSLPNFAVGGD
jgi:murein DD-endopeptidase MepM/ murein hydrolase activator NlpD